LQIASISPAADSITVKLTNATKFSRVHVFATRYVPEYDVFAKLSSVRGPEPYLFQQSPAESVYLTGRNIGDEYRYIIDRKYATKFPGNMLDRPSLLLIRGPYVRPKRASNKRNRAAISAQPEEKAKALRRGPHPRPSIEPVPPAILRTSIFSPRRRRFC